MYPAPSPADYSRLSATPFSANRLRGLAVVVVGAGALGNEVARSLGLLGTGTVKVVDPDTVQPSNLPRSLFFWDPASLGQNKASALVRFASQWFPDTRWSEFASEIADVGFQNLVGADLIFSCVDSDLARLEIAYIAQRLSVPVMDGGLGRQNFSHGRVTYFPGRREAACFSCLLSPSKRRQLLETWQGTLRPCSPGTGLDDAELVSTPTMAAVVGALQVEFGLRNLFLSREGQPVGSTTVEIRLDPERWISEFASPASADCPFHEPPVHAMHPLPDPKWTIRQFLEKTGGDDLLLDWPLCVEAKCMACAHTWEPKLRLAVLRRRGSCPACGATNILEVQTIRAIGAGSSWMDRPLSALQLPLDHLFTVGTRSGNL